MRFKAIFLVFLCVITSNSMYDYDNSYHYQVEETKEVINCNCCKYSVEELQVCGEAPRFKRKVRDLSSFLLKMGRVSRLVSGISIQLGLLDNTLNSQEFTRDILHIGIQPDNITVIDPDKLIKEMMEIRGMAGKLTAQDASVGEAVEKWQKMHDLREQLKKLTWTDKELIREMTDLKANGVDLSIAQQLKDKIDVFQLPLDPNAATDKMASCIGDIKQSAIAIPNLLKTLANFKTYPAIKSFETNISIFVGIIKQSVTDKKILAKNPIDDNFPYITSALLQPLSDASKIAYQLLQELRKVQTVITTRKAPRTTTKGFSSWKDVEELFRDLQDDWMKRLVKMDSFTIALHPLRTLGPLLESADKVFNGFGDKDLDKLSKYISHVEWIQKTPTESQKFTDSLDMYLKCSEKLPVGSKDPDLSQIDPLLKLAEQLDEDMTTIETLLTLNDKKTLDLLIRIDKMAVVSSDPLELRQTVQKLKDDQEVQKLRDIIGSWNLFFQMDFKKNAEDLLAELPKLKTFNDSLDGYKDLFQCLLTAIPDPEADRIHDAMELIKEIKDPKIAQVLDQGQAVITKLITTDNINKLETLETEIGKLKVMTATPESKELKSFKKANMEALVVAMLAIRHLEKVFGVKSIQRTLTNHGIKVLAEVIDLKTVPEIDKIPRLRTDFDRIVLKLSDWIAGIQDSDSILLSNMSYVFTSAKSIPSSTVDLETMRASLETLRIGSKDPFSINQVHGAVEKLIGVGGLDFSGYAKKLDIEPMLSELDLFFVEYKKKFSTPSPPSVKPQVILIPTTTIPPTTTTTDDEEDYGLLIGGICVGAAFLIILAILYYSWKKLKEEKLAERRENRREKKKLIKPEPKPELYIWGAGRLPEQVFEHFIDLETTQETFKEITHYAVTEDVLKDYEKELEDRIRAIHAPLKNTYVVYKKVRTKVKNYKRAVFDYDNPDLDFDVDAEGADLPKSQKFVYKMKDKAIKKKYTADEMEERAERLFGEAFEKYCTHVMMTINLETGYGLKEWAKTNLRYDASHPSPLEPKTQIKLFGYGDRFANDFIHANMIHYPNHFQMVITQEPQLKNGRENSTVEKFYWMAKQLKSRYIFMLTKESTNYFPRGIFEELLFDRLKVTCISTQEVINGEITIRKLNVEGELPFYVKHIYYPNWPENSAPADFDHLNQVLKMALGAMSPVIVHCSDGLNRSAVFAYTEYARQALELNGKLKYAETIIEFRRLRAGAINKPIYLASAITAAHQHIKGVSDLNTLLISASKKFGAKEKEKKVDKTITVTEEEETGIKKRRKVKKRMETLEEMSVEKSEIKSVVKSVDKATDKTKKSKKKAETSKKSTDNSKMSRKYRKSQKSEETKEDSRKSTGSELSESELSTSDSDSESTSSTSSIPSLSTWSSVTEDSEFSD